MKAGEIYSLDQDNQCYIWLKHKIEHRKDSPMNLGEKCWIVGIYAGPTPMQAFRQGELGELVYSVPRKSPITRIGHLDVSDEDIEWPEFYMQTSDGKGGKLFFLCKGYEVVKQVKKMKKEVRFGFGMSLERLAEDIKDGTLQKKIAERKLS